MGTRHLIAVYKDGETKIAQYGQWDGYPQGAGLTILRFLETVDLSQFEKDVAACTMLDPSGDYLVADYPHLSRDVSADILNKVPCTQLDHESFAGDGLFCEWAYAIDLDAGTFEVYEGFQKELEDNRFAKFNDPDDDYCPPHLVASFMLSDLPSEETFLELEKTYG